MIVIPRIPTVDVIDQEFAERSLAEYCRQAWQCQEPETDFLDNWHIDCIAEYLEAVSLHQIRRLVINMPPRSLKSTIVSIDWPTWLWGPKRMPWLKFINASYAQPLSNQHSMGRRDLIESEWFQDRWGSVFELAYDQNTKSHFANDRGGEMLATSVLGVGTGFGCHHMIVDDAHDTERAESEKTRKSTVAKFRSKLSTRLNNKKQDTITIVMQRVHYEDLAGICLEMGYTHLCLEGRFSKRRHIVLPFSLRNEKIIPPPAATAPATPTTPSNNQMVFTKRVPEVVCDCSICTEAENMLIKKAGGVPPPPSDDPPAKMRGTYVVCERDEYLHENREGAKEHAEAMEALTPIGYVKQYGQRPAPEDGVKFKRQYFRYFRDKGDHWELIIPMENQPAKLVKVMKDDCETFATIDTATSEATSADYTVISLWAFTKARDLLLFDVIRGRMLDPDVDKAIRNVVYSGRVQTIAIETKANGIGLFQRYKMDRLPVAELKADTDKISRSTTACLDLANGKTYFLQGAFWIAEFELELVQFPNGPHDDQVDTVSYASIYVGNRLRYRLPDRKSKAGYA